MIHEYLSPKELGARLGISTKSARHLAKSDYLRRIKGAVLNVNLKGVNVKYEKLRIRFDT